MAKYDDANSLIGEGSIFEGKFYISGSLQISGKFEGEIHTEDHLFIAETGKVKTNIIARKVTIGGTLIGNIRAEEEVVLLAQAKVLGNIEAPVLNIQKGAVHKGEISLTAGQAKDVQKIIKDAFSSTPGIDDILDPDKTKSKEFNSGKKK